MNKKPISARSHFLFIAVLLCAPLVSSSHALAGKEGKENAGKSKNVAQNSAHAAPKYDAIRTSAEFREGLRLLDRGDYNKALAYANNINDRTLADIVRGEAYADGAGNDAASIYDFLERNPQWPERAKIMTRAEALLVPEESYAPLLSVYSVESQPVTSQGFDAWVATLSAAGKNETIRDAARTRWREAKKVAGREDEFRQRYGRYLTKDDDAARLEALDDGKASRWKDRHIQIRDYLSSQNYDMAYRLASAHGMSPGGDEYATAEFLAGWLSLRKLKHYTQAQKHFENLYEGVKTPVSKSRAAYWLGRTAEARGNNVEAQRWYEEGATHQAFFYGQLSAAKIYPNASITMPPEPAIPANVASSFARNKLVHAVRALASLPGENDRTVRFFRTLTQSLKTRADFVQADDLARGINNSYLQVVNAKAANQRGYILNQRGYPMPSAISRNGTPETALVLGLIRQESEFRSDVESDAGAKGLMQLMPSTAKSVAKDLGMTYSESRLFEPAYNISLGRKYIGDRIDGFSGSYILAIAAYNAGRGRVGEWLETYGDPRDRGVDPVDWIETIPIYETRNYVQRVLENTQVYRARLAGDRAKLGILQDLSR